MLKRRIWPVYPAGIAVIVLAGLAGTVGAATQAGAAAQVGVAARVGAGMAPAGAGPALPPGARLAGAEPPSVRLHVTVALRSAHPARLDRLATQVATPGTTRFRHFLRPAQVQRRFGPPAGELARARAWLRAQHLVTQPVLADGLLLPVTGSVRQVEAAFRVKIARVRLAGGRLAWVNRSAPQLPTGLRRWVAAVVGLDSLHVLHPELAHGAAPSQVLHLATQPVLGSGGGPVPGPRACPAARNTRYVYTAPWLATAYKFSPLYRAGDFGQHVTVALYELADYANRDISNYERCYQISPSVRRVPVDGGTTIAANPNGTVEVTADIEVVAAMAPQASILVYETPASGAAAELDNYGAIAQQDRAQVVSTSWGGCEPGSSARTLRIESEIFQEMSVQGQSMLAAAGDDGSVDCMPPQDKKVPPNPLFYSLQVDDPGSQPFVTSVGGTEITRFGSPPVQSVWNQTPYGQGFKAPFNGRPGHPAKSPGNIAGGGGISRMWQMPSWQAGFDHSGNSSGKPCHAPRGQDCREVPDVSALAARGTPAAPGVRRTRGYVIYGTAGAFQGNKGWQTVGGTSLATPLWAALTALADQQRASHRLGLLSPSLYRIDRIDPKAFTDVVTGNNDYLARGGHPSHHTCRYGGQRNKPCYHASRGYDMASGLGTPQASYLVAALLRQHSNAGLG